MSIKGGGDAELFGVNSAVSDFSESSLPFPPLVSTARNFRYLKSVLVPLFCPWHGLWIAVKDREMEKMEEANKGLEIGHVRHVVEISAADPGDQSIGRHITIVV